ncbi:MULTISPECIES: hypothetical protein [Heyndrickxia]|uniref:hypothetical protein n=1 Tax=Heyndrickxia TaxID=2837504 RepID=UPI00242B67D6|nr:hypothetical protein [Heyndrickxia oleronia]MCI1743267.1 hypothetical protein [Heyndrickxia oleronia]MCI1760231.1 hypothetical protein [Heyndrickxia oleronia]
MPSTRVKKKAGIGLRRLFSYFASKSVWSVKQGSSIKDDYERDSSFFYLHIDE